MDRNTRTLVTRLLLAGGVIGLSAPASAEFLKDSKASLELRNFYFNRDYRQDNAAQSRQEEWAQGFLSEWWFPMILIQSYRFSGWRIPLRGSYPAFLFLRGKPRFDVNEAILTCGFQSILVLPDAYSR
jgi:hypothetical protein